MNLIRTAFSTPRRLFLLPPCNIAIQQLSTTANYTSKHADSVFNSWRDLVKNPTDWCDYRGDKLIGLVNAKYPDFKHKTNGAALWLSTAPNSVLAGLEGLNVGKSKKEDSWKNFVKNPHKWWDNRLRKINVKEPDFKHKETGEGLWLNSSPKWVLEMVEGLNVGKGKKEDSWKSLVENPDKWWDNRPTKTNVKEPDFKHKETDECLWLHKSPKWVLAGLDGFEVAKCRREDRWKNLVENPDKWWDDRARKTNVKEPDFRHKETGDGLWLDSSPKSVLAVLEGLNVGKGKKEDSWKNLVENPDKWLDNRPTKTNVEEPDFKHKETSDALWLDSSPKWVLTVLKELNVEAGKKEDSWMNLVEYPDKWWDNRTRKTRVNGPDFIHKETSEALWLDSSPKWVLAMVEELNVGKGKKNDSWKNLVENPCKWRDNRPTKTNVKAPDFTHKETDEGLWVDNAPKWVVLAGPEEINLAKRKKEDSWKNLVENPDKWLDNRPTKTNVNAPDFIYKETNEALWLDSCPKWVLSQLPS